MGTLLTAAPLATAHANTPDTADISVRIEGLRNHEGMIHACMTRQEKLYLHCDKDPASYRLSIPASNTELHLTGITPGDYALAILHDENGNGKVDTNFVGMPKEGVGFSNNASGFMGPPAFSAVRFHVNAGHNAQTIRIKYLL